MTARRAGLLEYLHRLLSKQSTAPAADAELLDRFVHQRDEAAFTELVERHGRMVERVCRRVLADADAARDASQAVLLVLARKAGSIRPRESLAAWLHGVAWRIARKARAADARRLSRVTPTPDLAALDPRPDPLSALTARELLTALDEEVQRLPLAYRLPLILCCLEGHTQEEAARKLGWTPGSVKGRLERGRTRLHARLVRRGLTLSAVLAAVEVSRAAGPAFLTGETVRAALVFAAGRGLAGACVSARVAILAEGGLKAMAITKAKLGVLLLLAASATAAGTGLLAHSMKGGEERKAEAAAAPQGPAQDANRARPESDKPARVDRYGDPLPPGVLARLGTARLRHGDGRILTFSADGKDVISVGADHAVRFWDAASGRLRRKLPAPPWYFTFTKIACSADSSTMVVARQEPRALVAWSLTAGKELGTIPWSDEPPTGLALSPDGRTLAAAGRDGVIHLLDPATGKERLDPIRLWPLAGLLGQPDVLFSPDGKVLASVSNRYDRVQLWDAATGKELRRIDTKDQVLAFSPGGKMLATAGGRMEATLRDSVTGRILETFTPAPTDQLKRAICLTFSPDGKTLAVGGDGPAVILWDVAARKELRRIPAGVTVVVLFAPDGKTLATSAPDTIRLWEVATGKDLYPSEGHRADVNAVAFSPDGRQIASASHGDQSVRLWDAATGKPLLVLPKHASGIRDIGFTAGGRGIVSGSGDGKLRLFDSSTGNPVREFSMNGPKPEDVQQVFALQVSADGKRLAGVGVAGDMGVDFTVWTWDIADGKQLVKRSLAGAPKSMVLSPDAKTIAMPIRDALILEEVETGKQREIRGTLPPTYRPVFSPDSKALAAPCYVPDPNPRRIGGTPRSVAVFDLEKGTEILTLETGWVAWIAFSPDRRYLASPSTDDVRLWELASGRQVLRRLLPAPFTMAPSLVGSLAFAPDGRRLATGLFDSTVLVWDLAPGDLKIGKAAKELNRDALNRLWSDLAGEDHTKGYAAIWTLSQGPGDAIVAYLRKVLAAARLPDAGRLKKLLLDLDSEQFAVRESATNEVDGLAEQAGPLLRAALAGNPSLEVRGRLEKSLSRAKVLRPGNTLRAVRAVEVLERIGTVEAGQVLEALAKGAPEARLTQEAKAASERLAKRRAGTP